MYVCMYVCMYECRCKRSGIRLDAVWSLTYIIMPYEKQYNTANKFGREALVKNTNATQQNMFTVLRQNIRILGALVRTGRPWEPRTALSAVGTPNSTQR